MKPAPLKPGDKIAIVATAKRLERPIEPGLGILASWGLDVCKGQFLNNPDEYFSASDANRLADLQWAMDNPDVKAICFARGGYGTTRILDQADYSSFSQNPKWTIGFSDLTGFQLQMASLGIAAVHGPMAYTLGQDDASDVALKNLLFGEQQFAIELNPMRHSAEGKCMAAITGGNLSLIYESIGAANEMVCDGKILFLEEVGESLYAVDRMLNKLKRTGKLDRLAGLIVGDFSHINDPAGYFSRDCYALIASYFYNLNIPKAFGFPGGHENRNISLLMNAPVQMTVESGILYLDYK
ncbi:S66 peptidase family protein [Roseivirga thermotolerans]|uniref:S66 peptidase family protein n=1 Tax=Roseivirga thermotolerans TaxID=1758176 RepID=UPI00273DBDD7|nr:LD-carboxypeptidase [Roseivirga thermotolerans]